MMSSGEYYELRMLLDQERQKVQQLLQRVALLEDDDPVVVPRAPGAPAPLTSVLLESGQAITISNSYTPTLRYLWVDIEARTGEWKANTQSPFPDKVLIYDGASGYGSELIITGH